MTMAWHTTGRGQLTNGVTGRVGMLERAQRGEGGLGEGLSDWTGG
jgi:hypothetical protein